MTEYKVLGVMSGTSLDGLDLAFCKLINNKGKWDYEIINAVTIPYNHHLTDLLARSSDGSAIELTENSYIYGKYIAEQVIYYRNKFNIDIDFIASHGHTIFHQPEKGITYQLGEGATIAGLTGITTVSDFRKLDVATGGEGAPLVPVGDELLFGEYDACLNMGGFSNISFSKNKKRIAFDICPVNILINLLAQKMGKEMDKNGNIAAGGIVIPELLKKLNEIEYYKKPYPKSLSREWLVKNVMPFVFQAKSNITDVIRTVYEHIAFQIAEVLIGFNKGDILITGGGAFNSFLMKLISVKTQTKLVIPEEKLVNYKEALIFALLGVLRYRNEINCYSSVTGAKSDLSVGVVHLIYQ